MTRQLKIVIILFLAIFMSSTLGCAVKASNYNCVLHITKQISVNTPNYEHLTNATTNGRSLFNTNSLASSSFCAVPPKSYFIMNINRKLSGWQPDNAVSNEFYSNSALNQFDYNNYIKSYSQNSVNRENLLTAIFYSSDDDILDEGSIV
jgi:hypothetical protein